MSELQGILTPVGRMVQGNPFEANTKNMQGAPLTDKVGNARQEFFFAIAIPKTDPGYPAFYAQIQAIAQAGWPQGQSQLPGFSWKIVDGDHPDNASKEGFPGHWVIRCSNGFTIDVYSAGGASRVLDKSGLKRGDYIRAYISVKSNGNTESPGVYINPSMIEVAGFGQEIKGGPDGAQVFGGAPVTALPPGASATPVAGVPIAQAPINNAPVPAAAPITAPPMVTPAPVMNAPPVIAPPMITAPPMVAAPVKTMTAKAGGATYESFIANNWTDQMMIDQGYLMNVAPGVQPDTQVLA